jgi:hypothetical protein
MDTSLLGSVATLSTSPEGLPSDSSDPNIEELGRLLVHDNDVPFRLVRASEKDIGPVWLVSWQTVQQVPQLYESARAPVLDQYFPAVLANNSLYGIPAGRWIAWLLTVPIALAVGWLLLRLARWLYQTKNRGVPFQWNDLRQAHRPNTCNSASRPPCHSGWNALVLQGVLFPFSRGAAGNLCSLVRNSISGSNA